MLCMSIMTNAYIIGFMSPRVELQQISVQSARVYSAGGGQGVKIAVIS